MLLLIFSALTLALAGRNFKGAGVRSAPVDEFSTCRSPSLETAAKFAPRPKFPVPSSIGGGGGCGGGTGPRAPPGAPARPRPAAAPPRAPAFALVPGIAIAAVRPPGQTEVEVVICGLSPL